MKYLNPADRIILYRKKYNITQQELSNEKIARVFIGMIEIGKRGLTLRTARLIAQSFNDILKAKKIDEKVSPEDLLKNKHDQALEVLEEMLSKKLILNTKVIDIDEALFQLPVLENSKYCLTIGKIFFDAGNVELAKYYAEKGLVDNFHKKNLENIKQLILLLANANEILGGYDNTISVVTKNEDLVTKKNDVLAQSILLKNANAVWKTGDGKKAVATLEKLSRKTKDRDLKFEIRSLIAEITYLEFKKAKKAIKMFDALLPGTSDKERFTIYSHLLEIGAMNKKSFDLNELINKTLNLIKTYKANSNETFCVYTKIAVAYEKLKEKDLAVKYFMEALSTKGSSTNICEKYDVLNNFLIFLIKAKKSNSAKIMEFLENCYVELFEVCENYKPIAYFAKIYPSRSKITKMLERIKI
ncbi:MAG: hypothetical protein ACRCSK_08020 [Fusobacteriaceae bacterium]